MARREEVELEDQVEDGEVPEEEEVQQEGDQPFLYAVSGQTPWWIVSILLHALIITLAGLMSMAINLGDEEPA
ncbi:MAG TPA: hypothetical protein VGP72_08965, partial [Planctomycetota bacterium]